MGTNFYLNYVGVEREHIGKRSAAGLYCWDCKATLCMGGESGVHTGQYAWHKACPVCGKGPCDEDPTQTAMARELGYNEFPPSPGHGVQTCCSFTWAVQPTDAEKIAKLLEQSVVTPPIVDEYEQEYSWDEFQDVLSECPIQYFDSIGKHFS